VTGSSKVGRFIEPWVPRLFRVGNHRLSIDVLPQISRFGGGCPEGAGGGSVLGWALAQSSPLATWSESGLRPAEFSSRIRISPTRPLATLPPMGIGGGRVQESSSSSEVHCPKLAPYWVPRSLQGRDTTNSQATSSLKSPDLGEDGQSPGGGIRTRLGGSLIEPALCLF